MDTLHTLRIISMIVFTMNKYSVATSRADCKNEQNALWDINDQRCTKCMDCPPGTGYTGIFPCGNGIEGVKGICEPCREGQFQSEHGQLQCTNCTQCINRVVLRNCSHEFLNSYDTLCGVCLPGYASLSENSTCVPCSELRDQTVPGCQTDHGGIIIPPLTDEQTTHTISLITSDIVPPSNHNPNTVEDHPPTTAVPNSFSILHWLIPTLVAPLVVVIVIVVVCLRKRRCKSSPSTNTDSSAERGEDNDVSGGSGGLDRTGTDGTVRTCVGVRCIETTPFIDANTENEGNPSPSSSGYISYDELEKFPRDVRLRCRYERALEKCRDTRYNRLVTECNVDILQQLSIELNPDGPLGTKNWRQLGCYLGVPNIIMENYKNLEDPLLNVLKYVNAREAEMLDAFLPKLKRVENHKALDVVVRYVLEELGKEHNSQNDGQNEQLGTGEDTSDMETTC